MLLPATVATARAGGSVATTQGTTSADNRKQKAKEGSLPKEDLSQIFFSENLSYSLIHFASADALYVFLVSCVIVAEEL